MITNAIVLNNTIHVFIKSDSNCLKCSLRNKCKSFHEDSPCMIFEDHGHFEIKKT